MQRIYLFILLFSASLFAQKADAWLTREAELHPLTFIQKTAKEIPATPVDKAGKLYAIARCYEYLNQEDISLKYYLQSKKEFQKLKLTDQAKDIALDVHRIISSQENYNKYGSLFIDEYFSYAQKTASPERLSRAWNEYAKIKFNEYYTTENPKYLDSAVKLYDKAIQYALKAKSNLLVAQLYNNVATIKCQQENFKASRLFLDKSRKLLIPLQDNYELFSNAFNYGITYFYEGNYAMASDWFKKAENYTIPKYQDKTKRALFKKQKEAYDALNDHVNRRKYEKMYTQLDESIKDEQQNVAIHDINVKYQVQEKDRQLSALEHFKDKFYRNRLLFAMLLFLVFLLALYSFIRWKRLDHHKKKLEVEKQQVQQEKYEIEKIHTETVDELEKVKKIITKGYIILKDKTKIYPADLMYIKSDDHYLHLFTQDSKSHFLREKLKDILLELPPNFVKCQKSYIVNINFIKSVHQGFILLKNNTEVPVSRGFKL